MEEAAALCVSKEDAEITVAHFLFSLLDTPYNDLRYILEHSQLDMLELKNCLGRSIAVNKQKNVGGYPSFSPMLVEALQDAWLLASTELKHNELRGGVFILAVLMNANRYLRNEVADYLSVINRESLRNNFNQLLIKSVEAPSTKELKSNAGQGNGSLTQAETTLLDKYTENYTDQARLGNLDPVLCRDDEISLMVDILCRRRKNNPIVVGDAGVGKSALIEGLAQRIVAGNVPEKLQDVELMALDLGALQAGASIKGEFEKRLKGVIEEIKHADTNIVLFIDEAHTMIGAGNAEGGGDAANLLKPALARGELRTIGATTWKEYKKYFEKDPALTRRFQLVKLDEPTVESAVHIMRGLSSVYEKSHKVLISDEGLKAAVELSARYISGRQLPDKAIDVLDTACARVAINLSSRPQQLERLENELKQTDLEITRLQRQQHLSVSISEDRISQLFEHKLNIESQLTDIEALWLEQQSIVNRIIELRLSLQETLSGYEQAKGLVKSVEKNEIQECEKEQLPTSEEGVDAELISEIKLELEQLNETLISLQEDKALVNALVDKKQVAAVIGDWTGVPINQMSTDQLTTITQLPNLLASDIKGQGHALAKIHRHLLTARADLRKTGRPQGAFLLVGPSGVGKTETVIQLTNLLYGGKQFLTTINMSEYQEKHTVSRLIGSPPGYVGFGEGGVLSEAIRQKPYSVVLLDEVEKAHPEVLNLFYQAFDKGELADGEGRLIDCQNVMFFMTSNLAYQTIVDFSDRLNELDDAMYPELAEFFKPALLARMETVPYLPLADQVLEQIISAKIDKLAELLSTRYKANVKITDDVIPLIREKANRSENGARMIESVIDGQLLPSLSLQILEKLAAEETVNVIELAVQDQQFCSAVG